MEDLSSDFDIAWKQALEWFFEPFVAFFFPVLHAEIDWSFEPLFLDKELQEAVPEAASGRGTVDKLVLRNLEGPPGLARRAWPGGRSAVREWCTR